MFYLCYYWCWLVYLPWHHSGLLIDIMLLYAVNHLAVNVAIAFWKIVGCQYISLTQFVDICTQHLCCLFAPWAILGPDNSSGTRGLENGSRAFVHFVPFELNGCIWLNFMVQLGMILVQKPTGRADLAENMNRSTKIILNNMGWSAAFGKIRCSIQIPEWFRDSGGI